MHSYVSIWHRLLATLGPLDWRRRLDPLACRHQRLLSRRGQGDSCPLPDTSGSCPEGGRATPAHSRTPAALVRKGAGPLPPAPGHQRPLSRKGRMWRLDPKTVDLGVWCMHAHARVPRSLQLRSCVRERTHGTHAFIERANVYFLVRGTFTARVLLSFVIMGRIQQL